MSIFELPFAPNEEPTLGFCPICGNDLYDYDRVVINDKVVCEQCAERIESGEATIDYIEAYPNKFIEFLRLGCGIDEIAQIIELYREASKEEMDDWLTR